MRRKLTTGYLPTSACFWPFGDVAEHWSHFGGANQIVDRSWLE
jgi:hypothetical protein